MDHSQRISALRAIAKDLTAIDREVYSTFGVDPLKPIIGRGDPSARIAIFGRDPGREEVRHGIPFIGTGGQKVRRVLHKLLFHHDMPDFQASIDAGKFVYWGNTVPYKPIGNKVWPMSVRRAIQPIIVDLLVHEWRGADILTLGRVAFDWFGLFSTENKALLIDHWNHPKCFERPISLSICAQGKTKILRLHPLPHPSPLNAKWSKYFPDMLSERLTALDFHIDAWRMTHHASEKAPTLGD